MNTKTVSQLDSEGYFISATSADESPKEPGVFHIPAGAIEVDPPVVPEGKRAKWTKDKWVFEDIPKEVVPEIVIDRLLECKTIAKSLLAVTDYTQFPDVQASLENNEDFVKYRGFLRKMFIEPIEYPVWPTPPVPIWKK